MDSLYASSIEFITWLQNTYPQLEGFFLVISSMGTSEFYLATLPLIYWSIDKRLGKILGFVLFFSGAINTLFKQSFRGPRPFWLDPSLGLLETDGYGIPSGHTQNSTALFILIASWIHSRWAWLLAMIMIALMGISRIYLGDHFISDVLAGLLLGTIILLGVFFWRRYFATAFSKRILGQRLLATVILPVVLAMAYVAIVQLIGEPDRSVTWAAHIPEAELESKLEIARVLGAMFGFTVGLVLESARIRFRADGPISKRIARYVIGIIITVIIWQGLDRVFPDDPLWLGIPLRILLYVILGLWASYYAPAVFVRLKLAEADPEPEMSMKL
jgi:membrane-associated phospholipid phosphatase